MIKPLIHVIFCIYTGTSTDLHFLIAITLVPFVSGPGEGPTAGLYISLPALVINQLLAINDLIFM